MMKPWQKLRELNYNGPTQACNVLPESWISRQNAEKQRKTSFVSEYAARWRRRRVQAWNIIDFEACTDNLIDGNAAALIYAKGSKPMIQINQFSQIDVERQRVSLDSKISKELSGKESSGHVIIVESSEARGRLPKGATACGSTC